MAGTVIITLSLLWFSRVSASSGYLDTLLPGMIVLAIAMGCLFVPLTVTAVSKVANTDAGLASALLNVGQQVGGSLGLSVLATVFGTTTRNYANDHARQLQQSLAQSTGGNKQLIGAIGGRLQKAGSNGLQKEDITHFVAGLPADQQRGASAFFVGPYRDFVHNVIAHGSAAGFLAGAVFAMVSIVVTVVMINVKKSDIPTDAMMGAGAA